MTITKYWLLFRFVLPMFMLGLAEIPHLLGAGHTMWGAAFVVLLLSISPILNLTIGMAGRPPHPPRERERTFRLNALVWEASEYLAAILLGFIEVGALATFNDPHPDQWFDILVVAGLFLGPYAALVLMARNRLHRCYEILAADLQKNSSG